MYLQTVFRCWLQIRSFLRVIELVRDDMIRIIELVRDDIVIELERDDNLINRCSVGA